MKTLLLLMLFCVIGTSCSDDERDCACLGEFYNADTGETEYVDTDCDRTPPGEGFVFIGCVDEEQ